jgi:hypothetical protein
MRGLAALGLAPLLASGFSACRDHPTVSPQKGSNPDAEQPVAAHVETDEEKSCREFVQGFYDWYLSPVKKDRHHPLGDREMDDAIRVRRKDLSVELYTLLKADRVAQARAHELVGLDFDPFTNSQDNSPKFVVRSVLVKDEDCRAIVWGMNKGNHRETVEPELIAKDGSWVFVNFHYHYEASDGDPPSEGDVIQLLKNLSNDRKRSK